MIINALRTRAPACLRLSEHSITSSSWCHSFFMAYSSTAGGFPVATATGFYARGAALQTNEGKHGLTLISIFFFYHVLLFSCLVFDMPTVRVIVCVCAGHDGGGSASPARQGPGSHGHRCQVRPPHRHHQGLWRFRKKWVEGVRRGSKVQTCVCQPNKVKVWLKQVTRRHQDGTN